MMLEHCGHERQVTAKAGSKSGDTYVVEDVLPCATPGCSAGMPGDGDIEDPRTRTTYRRDATYEGWRWMELK